MAAAIRELISQFHHDDAAAAYYQPDQLRLSDVTVPESGDPFEVWLAGWAAQSRRRDLHDASGFLLSVYRMHIDQGVPLDADVG